MKSSSVHKYLIAFILFVFLPLQCAFATSIGTDIAVSGNFTVAGNSTTTNATTTSIFATTGLFGSFFGAGLSTCNGGSNALTWSNGQFGCNSISGGGGNTYSSTTIGNSTQAGGLTISGGATTTGNTYLAGNVDIGTSTSYTMPTLSGTPELTINGSTAIEASSSAGAPNTLGIIDNATTGFSDVAYLQNKSPTANDAIDFMDNNGNIMGAAGYTNTVGGNFLTNQRVYISTSPPFAPPDYMNANSGVGQFTLSQEGVYNGGYVERGGYMLNNDWGIQIQDPLGNVMAAFSSPLSSSPNFGYGANELKVVGTNAYKYNNSPGVNGGASAQFTAINSDGDAVVVASLPRSMNYGAYPPGGGSLAAYGTGGLSLFAANASGKIHFYIGGENSGNLQATMDSSGNLGLGQATPNAKLDINSSSMILEQSATPSSSSAACTTGQIQWDSGYVYVCVGTNTWKRSALSTW